MVPQSYRAYIVDHLPARLICLTYKYVLNLKFK